MSVPLRQRLSTLVIGEAFDARVAVEEIIEALQERCRDVALDPETEARLSVRARLLETICGKGTNRGWTPATIAEKRDFATAYEALAAEVVPELRVRQSSDGPKALTRFFDGLRASPALGKVRLKHEFGSGVTRKYVNLQFDGKADRMKRLETSGLLNGTRFSIASSRTALFIRVDTPGVDPTKPFEIERQKVFEGIEAVDELATWLHTHEEDLSEILS